MYDDVIHITGHQHPDTDSIASSIAYAFFKKAMGIKAVPCRLGDLNNETKYLLERFGFEEPMLLKDARKKLTEIEMDSPISIHPDTTVLNTIRKMEETQRNGFAVVDDEEKVIGYISKSDLANIALGDTAAEIELLKQTPIADIAESINGQIVYDDPEHHISGQVSIVALTKEGIANYHIDDRIVIIGDEPEAQKNLIRNGAGLLIVVWAKEIQPEVIETAKEYHCPIILSGYGSMNTSRYLFFAPPIHLIMRTNMVLFKGSMYAEDAGQQMMKTRYRSYPVVDDDGKLLGYVSRYHILNYKNKKVILVDHNEFSQSVNHVEKAQILEVLDHHRINDFKTSQPVSFRNEIVGSTATIVATIFRENQIPLPKNLAGLLLGALLSDTLAFQSPTTTQKDKDVANILAAMAELDIDQFSEELFTATASSENRSMREMIVQDIKFYDIAGHDTMISQVIVASLEDVRHREKEITQEMDALVKKKGLDLLVVCFSSILEDGSIFYGAGEKASAVKDAFPDQDGEKPTLQIGILSRKGQILPKITDAITN